MAAASLLRSGAALSARSLGHWHAAQRTHEAAREALGELRSAEQQQREAAKAVRGPLLFDSRPALAPPCHRASPRAPHPQVEQIAADLNARLAAVRRVRAEAAAGLELAQAHARRSEALTDALSRAEAARRRAREQLGGLSVARERSDSRAGGGGGFGGGGGGGAGGRAGAFGGLARPPLMQASLGGSTDTNGLTTTLADAVKMMTPPQQAARMMAPPVQAKKSTGCAEGRSSIHAQR